MANQLSSLQLGVGAQMYPAFRSDTDVTGPGLDSRLGTENPQRSVLAGSTVTMFSMQTLTGWHGRGEEVRLGGSEAQRVGSIREIAASPISRHPCGGCP